MDRRDYLRPARFVNVEKRRQLDSKNLKEKRSIRRTTNFNLCRDIESIVQEVNHQKNENAPPKKGKVIDRKLALQKFRAEREALKKDLKEKKKPPFIVGIPHHGSSPVLKNLNSNNERKETTHEFKFQPYKIPQSEKKLTSPHTPTVLKRSVQKRPLKNQSNLVDKLNNIPGSSNVPDADEVLAAPLASEVDEETAAGTQNQIETEPLENIYASGTSVYVKPDHIEDKGAHNKDEDNRKDPVVSNLRRNPKRSHKQDAKEYIPVPILKPEYTDGEVQGIAPFGEAQVKNEGIKNEYFPVSEEIAEEEKEDRRMNNKDENKELSNQVAFQQSRLQLETTRLLELADQWQTVVLGENLPQEVVDEVDSLVGQTRLLTSDKFQQFRRLILQYEQKTGTHPVTYEDLNGFWDMVYLQVESLDKKYAALEALRNNNWEKPEPAKRKKLKSRPTKMSRETSSTVGNQKPHLHLKEDQQMQIPTTSVKHVVGSAPQKTHLSPYIALRLSSISRTSDILVESPSTDGLEGSKLILSEACATPRSALKSSWTQQIESRKRKNTPRREVAIEEAQGDTEQLTAVEEQMPAIGPRRSPRLMVMLSTPASCSAYDSSRNKSPAEEQLPAITPRKSMRIMAKLSTPANCSACDSSSCYKSQCTSGRKSSKKQSQRQAATPVQELLRTETKPEFTPQEEVKNKPSKSGVRFSLRPSILNVTENNNIREKPKKTTKRRQASVYDASNAPVEQDVEGLGARSRRSTLKSKKVMFESEVEERIGFKLPATPFRKSQEDS